MRRRSGRRQVGSSGATSGIGTGPGRRGATSGMGTGPGQRGSTRGMGYGRALRGSGRLIPQGRLMPEGTSRRVSPAEGGTGASARPGTGTAPEVEPATHPVVRTPRASAPTTFGHTVPPTQRRTSKGRGARDSPSPVRRVRSPPGSRQPPLPPSGAAGLAVSRTHRGRGAYPEPDVASARRTLLHGAAPSATRPSGAIPHGDGHEPAHTASSEPGPQGSQEVRPEPTAGPDEHAGRGPERPVPRGAVRGGRRRLVVSHPPRDAALDRRTLTLSPSKRGVRLTNS